MRTHTERIPHTGRFVDVIREWERDGWAVRQIVPMGAPTIAYFLVVFEGNPDAPSLRGRAEGGPG